MAKPDLRHAKSEEELWAARYDCRFQHRNAHYYDSGLNFVVPGSRRALDAGCGSGAFSFPLASRVETIVGMDRNFTLTRMALARQAEEQRENMSWVVGDIGHLPFAAGAFDVVGSYNVLHVVPLRAALKELATSTAAGGRVVIRVPYFYPSSIPEPLKPVRRLYTVLRRRLWRYSRTFGIRTGLRLMAQDLAPDTLALEQYWLPPEQIRAAAQECLPGCRIEQDPATLVIFWEKER